MSKKRPESARNILGTHDTFIAEVPWGENRRVLVFRREHGGRTYVRFRTWNLHRKYGSWYPTNRFFVVPLDHAADLARALTAAAQGRSISLRPRWYGEHVRRHLERLEELNDQGADEAVLDRTRRKISIAKERSK